MAELIWMGKHDRREIPVGQRAFRCRTDEVHAAVDCAASPVNRLLLGDRADVLRVLAVELAGQVALVYVDPPFDTGGTFDYLAAIPGAPARAPRVATPAYRDARGLDSWLGWFDETVRLVDDLLVAGGSLYVHLDAHTVHYAKVVLDEVFGLAAFQREIIWRIGWVSGFKSRARSWIRNHDTILFYAKGGKPRTFNKEYVPRPPGYVRRDGTPAKSTGYPIEDVWNGADGDRLDSIQIMSFSGEKVGYPTQKNEALVGRIVRASSNPGELVLDCFVGSGTTAVVAERLDRRWIASDVSPVAVHTTRKRLACLKPSARAFLVQALEREGPRTLGTASYDGPVGATGERGADGATAGEISIETHVDALRVSLAITGFRPSDGRLGTVPPAARRYIVHWSQWLEGWCVDWEHDEAVLRVGSSVWRASKGDAAGLPLSITREYVRPGRYHVLVKAFDLLGGDALATVWLDLH